MPDNNCIVEELGFVQANRDFMSAIGEAEDIRWIEIGSGIISAYLAVVVAVLTTPSGVGPVAGVGVASTSLAFTWRAVLQDLKDFTGLDEQADAVDNAFSNLQLCRGDHKLFGDNPLERPPSVFQDFPVIPFVEPDDEPSDDEIIIFDEDDPPEFEESEEDEIIILDE